MARIYISINALTEDPEMWWKYNPNVGRIVDGLRTSLRYDLISY